MSVGIIAQPVENPTCPNCNAALPTTATPLSEIECPNCSQKIMVPGRLGQQYRLTRLIGAGGMGAVYEGYDDGLARKIAVKVILREKAAEDPSFIDSFRKEAQAAARLNSQNIVSIYAFGDVDGQPYLVMELVLPDALDKLMAAGPMMPAAALNYCLQTAHGLRAASEHGLVHGDVKPENILINEAHEAKLADFGIAALAGAGASSSNDVWGTPYYIAPETLRKQKVDCRADIYSLGGTLYHAIAGVPPFEGADAVEVIKARLLGPARPLIEVRPDCPESINKIVMRMLEAEPNRRYPNYESLIKDMDKALAPLKSTIGSGKRITIKGKSVTGPISMPMPTVTNFNAPLVPTTKSKKPLVIGIIAGVACLVIATVVAILMMGGDKSQPNTETSAADIAMQQEQAARTKSQQQLSAAKVKIKKALEEKAKTVKQNLATVEADVRTCESIFDRLQKAANEATHEKEAKWLDLSATYEGETAPTELLRVLRTANEDISSLTAQATQIRTETEAIEKALASLEEMDSIDALEALENTLTITNLKTVMAIKSKLLGYEKNLNTMKRTAFAHRRSVEQEIVNAQRAEAEQRAKEEALRDEQKRIEEEVASIPSRMTRVEKELKDFMPEDATVEYQKVLQRLKSNEAKVAAEAYATRITVLNTFKTWLIEWVSNGNLAKLQKHVRRDFGITVANKDSIVYKGREMRWNKFFETERTRIIPVIEQAIANDITLKAIALQPSLRSELALGAAMVLHTYLADAIEKSAAGKNLYARLIEHAQRLKKTTDMLPSLNIPFDVEQAEASAEEEDTEDATESDEE